MQQFKFNDYVFEPQSLQLKRYGQAITIRPKALQLLSFLIQNRHRLVSKSEIMCEIWGSMHTRDYLLFQLISEIRKLSKENDLIRTQPNEGYQWVAPTRRIKPIAVLHKIAASIAVGIIGLFGSIAFNIENTHSERTVRLPAHKAFSAGVIALENQDYANAIKWLKFSLIENPESIQLKLFLAEALFLDTQIGASLNQLQSIINEPNLDAYSKISATDLLSQISQFQGRMHEALFYARMTQQSSLQAPLIANKKPIVGQCSVDHISERIRMLEEKLLPQSEQAIDDTQLAALPNKSAYQRQCDELQSNPIETSQCAASNTHDLYARKRYFDKAEAS